MATTPPRQEMSDFLFIRIAVERRYVRLGELREFLAAFRDRGDDRPALAIAAIRQGLLTRADVDAIEAIASSGEIAERRIERYQILTKIGEGGMGSVYAVVDPESMEMCAIKVLPDELAKDEDLVKRFQREGETACGLRHPSIVGGLRVVESEGQHFFAMEFVDGETVYDRLERDGVIQESEALKIVRDICLGLQYAEEKGLVHRDMKPENIMIDRYGTAKLCDMGLVKRLDASRVSRLTQSGMAIGTPHYISPEQARGEENVDHRSDIYALGATLYHMITGRVPFEGNTAAVIMTKHLTEELDWPSDVNPEICENTSNLVSKMMAKERRDRYLHARDAVADIDLILSGRAPSGEVLPPGASSIRQAVKMARARARAAERDRERTRKHVTAVHERIQRRRRHVVVKLVRQLLVRTNRRSLYYAAAAVTALAVVVIAAILGGSAEHGEIDLPPMPPPVVVANRPSPTEEAAERLRQAAVEDIPGLVAAIGAIGPLTREEAGLVSSARADALARFDREAENRLNAVLAGTTRAPRSAESTLVELVLLKRTFASSRVAPRIDAAIASLGPVGKPAAPVAVDQVDATHVAFPALDMVGGGALTGWRAYGLWRADGGVISYRYDPDNRYSISLQSQLGVGECRIRAELRTAGGTRGEVAVWEQGTEDTRAGTPDSSVSAAIEGDALVQAAAGWAALQIDAHADRVSASLGGRPLAVRRHGPLHHGRIRLSLEGGTWDIRGLQLTPLLAKGDSAYEAAFDDGSAHGWTGRRLSSGLAAVRNPTSPLKWAEMLGGQDLFEISDAMRLSCSYRTERVDALFARLIVTGGSTYTLRLSGNPIEGRWTALTVPVADFRSASGEPPPAGANVRSVGVGVEGPEDDVLVLSLVRFVR